MRIDGYDDGVPCWVDLMTPDADRAGAFYSALFGWEVPPGAPEAGGYRVAMVGDAAVAGLMPQMDGDASPVVWSTYVKTGDADATVATAVERGAQVIVEPLDVLDAGRMGVFADPLGAVISVWQPNQMIGAQLVDEPGTWSWSELITTDVEQSKDFYGAVFGWGAETHGEGPGSYTEWKVGGRSVGGMMPKPPMMPAEVPSHWGVYFSVADTYAAVERIKELGGSVIMPPFDVEPGRVAVVTDPGGAPFNVIALNESRLG
jgi:predicted enzyme related to lactoylglutathione lyase